MKTDQQICPNCGIDEIAIFYGVENVSTNSGLLLSTKGKAVNFPNKA